jgi:hypothetical protein
VTNRDRDHEIIVNDTLTLPLAGALQYQWLSGHDHLLPFAFGSPTNSDPARRAASDGGASHLGARPSDVTK